ncbi:hypothetical protein B7463_g9687, partial [Scytalidium lignicola]
MTPSVSSTSLTKILFNHVALPPQLPGKQDDKISQVEWGLINLLQNASRTLGDLTTNDLYNQFEVVCYVCRICKAVNAGGKLESTALAAEFRNLGRKEFLILHIAEQNAGLLIRRQQDDRGDIVIFEVFEASPLSEKVLCSKGSLKWEFPGSAVSIPMSEFNKPSFQDELATFLQQASTESIKQFAAHTHKAGSFAFESRDTTDPSLVTQVLMALLEVNGSRYPITRLCKRIKDDVCWTDGAEKPWRRCPMWLVLRVGIQRLLCTMFGNEGGRVYYKFLMCVVLSNLLVETMDHLHPEEIVFLKAKLCRRVVKLEVEKERASIPMRGIYESMFTLLEPTLQKATQAATERIELRWSSFKESIRKPIQYLPRYADPKDTYLSLPNSSLYLQQVLSQPLYNFHTNHFFAPYQLPVNYSNTVAATRRFGDFMSLIFSLSEIEIETESGAGVASTLGISLDHQCIKIAQKIDAYLDSVGGAYDHSPEQKSLMLLTVMELWVSMDKCAVQSFSLLNDYNPAFVPDILDVLQLPNLRDMRRLQKIQAYLHDRNAACSSTMTIFDDPTKGCFAERYFDESCWTALQWLPVGGGRLPFNTVSANGFHNPRSHFHAHSPIIMARSVLDVEKAVVAYAEAGAPSMDLNLTFLSGFLSSPHSPDIIGSRHRCAAAQMTGISVIQYYSVTIFKQIGIDGRDTLRYQAINSVTGLIGEFLVMLFVDKVGRRSVIITGNLAMCMTYIISTILLAKFPSSTNNTSAHWGFIIMTWIFNFTFASMGSLSWIIPAEIFDTVTRSKGVAIAAMTSFAFNTMTGQVTPIGMEHSAWRFYINQKYHRKLALEEMNRSFSEAPLFVGNRDLSRFTTSETIELANTFDDKKHKAEGTTREHVEIPLGPNSPETPKPLQAFAGLPLARSRYPEILERETIQSSPQMALARVQITSLKFEHHHSGLGLSSSSPRISWSFSCSDEDVRGWMQYAYEIQVLRHTQSTESYYVESPESILVPWQGEPLQSREQAKVRIRAFGKVKDGESVVTSEATPWSPWDTVECGLLERSCWTAQMIGASDTTKNLEGPLQPLLFRKVFQLPSDRGRVVKARLYLTAFGIYQVYINGSTVGNHVLAPGWTSYNHRLYYQIFDVTALVHEGTANTAGMEVAEGWYAGRLGWGEGKRYIYGKALGALMQLEVEYEQGERQMLSSDGTWKCHVSSILKSELYDGELYDGREEQYEWATCADFDDSSWTEVKILDFPTAKLISPDMPPVRITQEVNPVDIFTTPSGKTILDFGQNLVGKLRIRSISGTSGHKITFIHAEVMENGELGTRPLRTAKCTDTIILSGKEIQNWSPKFTFHGFRYVQIDGWDSNILTPLSKQSITALVIHTDMSRTGFFDCSHPIINKLHENAVWSMRGNFVSIPTDCPQRDERLGWTGDIQVFGPSASFLYDTTGMLGSWLEDVSAEQLEQDGIPPLVVPNVLGDLWPPTPQAVWGDVAVLLPWAVYMASGDVEILRRQYQSMTAWVDQGIQRGSDGLWDPDLWQLGDWLDPNAAPDDPGDARTSGTLVADAYLVHVTFVLSRISEIIGNKQDTKRYQDAAHRMKAAFQYKYIAPSGLVVADTPTALSLAIVFNLFSNDLQVRTAASRLVQLVKMAKFRIATGFAGTPIITHALSTTGNEQIAYRILQEKKCPSWMYPITMGATTIWERWDSMLPDGSINPGEMTSFNHFALGSIVNWLHEVVGGIRPREAGWRKFDVQPRPGGTVRSAEVAYTSPYGRIACKWSLEGLNGNELFTLNLTVPPNSEAWVVMPGTATSETVGDTNEGVVKVESGNHVFSCKFSSKKWPIESAHPFISIVDDDGEIV